MPYEIRMDVPQASYLSPCPPGLQCSPGDMPLSLLAIQESTTPLQHFWWPSMAADVQTFIDA